ncbi:MAG: hypothetical protein Q4P23_03725, partial [Micrococcaceae bacterium]|nr:hypothetical protein [Micrococcaceae bacterium]
TFSLVMMPCDWIGTVMIRKLTLGIQSTTWMIQVKHGRTGAHHPTKPEPHPCETCQWLVWDLLEG